MDWFAEHATILGGIGIGIACLEVCQLLKRLYTFQLYVVRGLELFYRSLFVYCIYNLRDFNQALIQKIRPLKDRLVYTKRTGDLIQIPNNNAKYPLPNHIH